MKNIQWSEVMEALSSPIELQTGKQKKWFRASLGNSCIVINSAVDNLPSCDLKNPRSIQEKEYMKIVLYYPRWKSGERGVRQLAQKESRNTSYLFALMDYLRK